MFSFNSKKKRKLKEKLEKELNLFKIYFKNYCEETDTDSAKYVIHMIECIASKIEYARFKITLSRPGQFIGKGGQDINALTNHMNVYFKKEIFLELVEYNPLKPNYTKSY